MEHLPFVFADRATVPCYLGLDVQQELISHLLEVKPDRILLVCDRTAHEIHGDYFSPLVPTVSAPGETLDGVEAPVLEKFLLPPGDEAKSWEHLSQVVRWAFDVGATKKSLIVAFGGGALLNVVGLFASILMRGTKLMYVPTTFLAMHDVVTSLKTSICFDGRKNNIGTFYAPLKILIDVAFCNSLPREELFSGLGELAKNAALFGGRHADGFIDALSNESVDAAHGGSGEEFVMEMSTLLQLLRLGIEAKMDVLAIDAYEKTTAMVFEYGHTVSHAIEKAYGDGVVPHGLGVVYGMLSSSYAAERMGIMSTEHRRKHDELCWLLLRRWPLPEPKPAISKVMKMAMKDSKRGITSESPEEISDVLLVKIGEIVPTKTANLSKFPASLVQEWLATMGFPAAELDEEQCVGLLKEVKSLSTEKQLVNAGYEPMTVGFANRVCGAERKGVAVVAKSYTELAFLRLTPESVGAVDVLAGENGLGPRVLHSSASGLVMERLPGRTLAEADMHREDKKLLAAVAQSLAKLHGTECPKAVEGEPMLWRTVDKMLEVAEQRPELLPGNVSLQAVKEEVRKAKKAEALRRSKVVLGHGDFKPANVLYEEGRAMLIDFELAGPNFRGFDLFKVFRTALPFSERSLRLFLEEYLRESGEECGEKEVEDLARETKPFEPLTWLEAAVFFLALPQFKPEETARWHSLAADRWLKFEETRCLLY